MPENEKEWFQWWTSVGVHSSMQFGSIIFTFWFLPSDWGFGIKEGMRVGAKGFRFLFIQIDYYK